MWIINSYRETTPGSFNLSWFGLETGDTPVVQDSGLGARYLPGSRPTYREIVLEDDLEIVLLMEAITKVL